MKRAHGLMRKTIFFHFQVTISCFDKFPIEVPVRVQLHYLIIDVT